MITNEDEHKEKILDNFNKKFITKYDKGVEEHGGGLYRKPLGHIINWGYDEILDFVCYYSTIQDHIENIKNLAEMGVTGLCDPKSACKSILNIIQAGSCDGSQANGD